MAREPLTRAEFLKILAAGAGGIVFLRGSADALAGLAGPDDQLDRAALEGDAETARQAGTILAVAKGSTASSNVKRAIAAVGGMKKYVSSGDTVVIKPNISHPNAPKYAVTTNPGVVATLVTLARQAGAGKVLVMDNPVSNDPAACYSTSGISSAVKAAGGSMQIMGKSGYKSYAIPGHLLKNQSLYAAIVNADVLINVPIAKTHSSTKLTLAGKNMMGCTSNRQRMHTLGLSQSIAEINAKLKPELTVIDAMRILVRNGPSGGSLSDVAVKNTVVACHDWVAADTWACRLFGVSPSKVPYLKAAANMHLGTMNLSSVTIRNV
ncbi:MAG TPA: DUF362 domain-containing protein [Thermoleophilia bacterium]|nr:DUF362 domain-containing protein [Thermoleophilia bacterium]